MAYSGVGTAGQLLLTNTGATSPTWTTLSGDMTVTATGAATVNSISGTSPIVLSAALTKFGTHPAASGAIGIPNNSGVYFRNAANNADISGINLDTSNEILLGDGNVALHIILTTSNQLRFDSSGNLLLLPGNNSAGVGSGHGLISLRDSPTLPTSAPTTGSFLYSNTGSLEAYASGFQFNTAIVSPTITQTSESTAIKGSDLLITPQQSTHATDQGGGNLVVDFQTPTGAGVDAHMVIKTGAVPILQIGPYGNSNTYGGIYAGNITPGSTNFAFLVDIGNTNTFLNTGSVTHFGVNNVDQVTISTTSVQLTPSLLEFAATTTSPTISQISESTTIKGSDLLITPQQSTHATDQGGGNLKLTFQAPTGAGVEAGLQIFRGATQYGAIQPYNAGAGLGVAGTILLNNAALSTTNWMAQGAGGLLFLNASTEIGIGVGGTLGTSIDIQTNGVQLFGRTQSLGSGTGVLGITNAGTVPTTAPSGGLILYSNSGALETYASAIQFNKAQASPLVTQVTQTTDTATNNLTITSQQPFATASGGNRKPGDIILNVGTPTNSGTTYGNFTFNSNGSTMFNMVQNSGNTLLVTQPTGALSFKSTASYVQIVGTSDVYIDADNLHLRNTAGTVVAANYQQLTYNGTSWVGIGIISATLTDANVTVDCGASSAGTLNANQFVLPAATLSTNRTVTINTDSAVANEAITVVRLDVTANTLAIVNGGGGGGTLYTFPASKKRVATFVYNGTNWFMSSTAQLS